MNRMKAFDNDENENPPDFNSGIIGSLPEPAEFKYIPRRDELSDAEKQVLALAHYELLYEISERSKFMRSAVEEGGGKVNDELDDSNFYDTAVTEKLAHVTWQCQELQHQVRKLIAILNN